MALRLLGASNAAIPTPSSICWRPPYGPQGIFSACPSPDPRFSDWLLGGLTVARRWALNWQVMTPHLGAHNHYVCCRRIYYPAVRFLILCPHLSGRVASTTLTLGSGCFFGVQHDLPA